MRSAIVTGASAGIGLAVIRELAADHCITLVARDERRLAVAAEELAGGGCEVLVHAADLALPGAATGTVDAHLARFGGLDLVVANAGAGTNGSATRTEPAALGTMTRLNVDSLFELAASAVPALRRGDAGDGERTARWFVVVASLAGTWPMRGFAGYSATKAAAVSLARSIAIEEAAAGVRACAICPAFVDTELSAWARDRVPPDAMLEAADVAEAVRFLLRLSPNASVTELVLRRAGAAPSDP